MTSEDYIVKLDHYSGPLDLLLYLIRQEEVDIYNIPISRITDQYLGYVDLLGKIDPNAIGEFLVLAATLMEIKSRMMLPKPPPEEGGDEDLLDPRLELVHQLLEYKKFKDAAGALESSAHQQSLKFPRVQNWVPLSEDPEVDLEHVQVWDLLNAFGKLMRQVGLDRQQHEVIYDDTPIALHATDILDRLERANGSMEFTEIFEGHNKSEIIGLFLALLELIRGKRIRVEPQVDRDRIIIHLIESTPLREADLQTTAPQQHPEPQPSHLEASQEGVT